MVNGERREGVGGVGGVGGVEGRRLEREEKSAVSTSDHRGGAVGGKNKNKVKQNKIK